MNRLASIRVGAVFASVVMALAGCDCGKVDCTQTPTAPECTCDTTDLTASFTTPKDGDMVEQTSNVQVTLARRGAAVNVGSAKLQIRGPGATEFGTSRDGVTDGANATFSGVQLQPGENALRATVVEANCTNSVPAVTIVVTAKNNVTPPPVVLGCDFPQDANTDGVLNATELPAGQAVSVRVRTQNGAGATFSAPNSSPASAPIMNETATLTVPGPTADGTFAVTGTVTRGTGMPTCNASIRVQRAAGCAIENTTSTAARGPLDDADRQTAGYQLRATAQVNSGAVDRAEIVGGGTTRAITFSGGMASADFTVPATGTQNFDVVLSGFDAAGNRCTVVNGTRTVPLDFEAPTVSITSPADGATVTTTSATLTVAVGGAANGTMCQVFVNGVDGPTGTATNGTFSVSVAFPNNGTYSLRAECSDAAGNRGSSATTLADGGVREHTVIVQLPSNICSIVFQSIGGQPAVCPAFANRLTGGALSVAVQASSNCTGQPIRLFKDATAVAGTGPTFSVPVGMATAMFTLRAEIDNLPGATTAVTSTTCGIEVNTNTPNITSPVAPINGPAIVNASADGSSSTAGAQRQLTFTAAVPPMGRVDVCVNSAMIAGVGAAACPGPSGWFVLSSNVTSPANGFTFPEGTYEMKIVVIGAGTPPPESPALPVLVDVTVPCISSAGVSLPQDLGADGGVGDGRLNIAELGSASPQLRFTVDSACGSSNSASVRTLSGTTVINPSYSAALANPAGLVTLDLTTNVAQEQDLSVFVELTDEAGNRNTPTSNAAAGRTLRVDRTAPTCSFTAPTTARTLNLSDLMAGALPVQVQTSADVPTVSISEGSNTPQSVVPNASFIAAANFSITGTRAVTFNATCRDQSGNAPPAATRTVNVDFEAPTFTLSSPTTGFVSNTTQVTTTATGVSGNDGNAITIRTSAQASDLGSLTAAGSYTATLSYPIGMNQTITAIVVDNAGNSATRTATGVNISSTNCQIALTATNGQPPFVRGATTWLNRSHVPGVGASSGTATINANSSNCRLGETVTLARVTPAGGPTIAPATTSTNGNVSFANVAVADGETWSLTIQNNPTPVSFSFDLVAPSLTGANAGLRINADTAAPVASIFFVAAQNNLRVRTNTAGYYPDLDGNGANGGQANFAVNGVTGAVGGTVTFTIAGTPVAGTSQTVSTSPQSISLPSTTLPQNSSGEFAVVVVDEGGNSVDVYRGPVVVDVIPPSAPTGLDGGVLDARAATASIAWNNDAVDDEGSPSSGAVARYVIKWTTNSVAGNNAMATSDDYFGASAADATERAPSGSQMAENLTLPPLNTYYLGVRARDEVFNFSNFGGPVVRDNFWTRVRLDGPASTSFGNGVLAEASLNNDGLTDVVVGAASATTPGTLFVYYGSAALPSQPTCVSPACQTIVNPDTTGTWFASDFSSAGDVGGGDTKADLLVGQNNFPSSSVPVGRAFLFFGTNTAATLTTSTFIEFRGADNAGRIGGVTRIIPDINGDGLGELVLTAPFANANKGRVFIYAGRTLAAWQSARTSTDGTTGAPFIQVASTTATWTIEGGAVTTPSTGYFGRARFSVSSISDLDGDGRAELAIGLGPETINRLQIWSSSVISGATSPILNSARLQDLSAGSTGTSTNVQVGFGAAIVGGVNVLNGAANDLITSWPGRAGGGGVFIYADLGSTGAPTSPSLTISASSVTLGASIAASNLNTADSRVDLVLGTNSTASSNAWIVWQQAGATAFDSSLGSSTPAFWTSRFDGTTLAGGSTNNSIGRASATRDVTGDANVDLILADERNNVVFVWR